jgi:hypothetical protein
MCTENDLQTQFLHSPLTTYSLFTRKEHLIKTLLPILFYNLKTLFHVKRFLELNSLLLTSNEQIMLESSYKQNNPPINQIMNT